MTYMASYSDERTDNSIFPEKREITKRAVLWLGLVCDVKCIFCYDAKINKSARKWLLYENALMALEKFKRYYDCCFVDFMGGEPTIYPHIINLVKHSSDIGLLPTCVTNGISLTRSYLLEKLKEAGLHDILMSVHGLGKTARLLYGVNFDVFSRQLKAIDKLNVLSIPFRINTTVINRNIHQLPELAKFASKINAQVLNLISFNPYFEWSTEKNIHFQVRHSEACPYICEAIEIAESNNIEINARYFPLCVIRGYEKNIYTNFQLPYDPHEWDFNSWFDLGARKPISSFWYLYQSNRVRKRNGYIYTHRCSKCSAKLICDGIHSQYYYKFGDEELTPFTGKIILDPKWFTRQQPKKHYNTLVEPKQAKIQNLTKLHLSQFRYSHHGRAGLDS